MKREVIKIGIYLNNLILLEKYLYWLMIRYIKTRSRSLYYFT